MERQFWLLKVIFQIFLISLVPVTWVAGFSTNTESLRGNSQKDNVCSGRPVTVVDAVEMTEISSFVPDENVVTFSPDGSKFALVVQKGSLQQNTVEFSLIVFKTADALRSPTPETIVTMSSSSNREAIVNSFAHLSWLSDNDTIVFLGEGPGENPQVYKVSCQTRRLEKLTNHPTPIFSYAVSSKGDRLIYVAEAAKPALISESMRQHGFTVTTPDVWQVITGYTAFDTRKEIVIKTADSPTSERVGGIVDGARGLDLDLSPDGNYALVGTSVLKPLPFWSEYEDKQLRRIASAPCSTGSAWYCLRQYQLIDLRKRAMEPLINAPINFQYGEKVAWSPDSESLVLVNAFLPLDTTDPSERKRRQSNHYIAEIELPSRRITTIAERIEPFKIKSVKWDADSNEIVLPPHPLVGGSTLTFRKKGREWEEVNASSPVTERKDRITVALDQNINLPPRLVATEAQTRRKQLLLDLNPQFRGLCFGRVEAIEWKATDGHEMRGTLYYPPGYAAGKRYPLVIQTHADNPGRFWIDGPWHTGYAAQPLAGRGFVVLQMGFGKNLDEATRVLVTAAEAPREMAGYEGAIDYLDRMGLIDRDRVGIIGFSRSDYHVSYTLTHSHYRFAAATITDGVDFGYLQYLLFPQLTSEWETVNGGPPYGQSLRTWLERVPNFNLDRIRTPIRIVAIAPLSLLEKVEMYALLKRLGRPVDLIYIPEGDHLLVKPWERMTAQQGNVDWFAFWLKGEEDPDPKKADQYARWRELRKLQEAQQQTESKKP